MKPIRTPFPLHSNLYVLPMNLVLAGRLALIGLTIGLTTIAIIYSPIRPHPVA